ncbi:glycosyltransferase family protein [Aureimonas jatrophae]|jgi:predicted glycosyltransferase|uniref:Predicted glycosyl transferase n=1 Tax=Aureimonas jatrophae TaxID=1166073 RepID=A0A1H0EVZ3_9HYPH|nr:glycosyltransferase [Aureimonas jatrophae]MBB3950289.1 putative glycosyltransferase [Aureimonas jatrophae]SDN86540.1 Predicted glycosyl transferase [Aureimonas jatrophae]
MLNAPFPADRRETARGPRILIYSHDTFGLGHIRRCRAIANRLAPGLEQASIVIISGSPMIGSFEFGDGIDFVRVPGVVKLPDGSYSTSSLALDLEETVAMRSAVIMATARSLQPDILIVDKEPTGFRDELLDTLAYLRAAGTRIVLGLRDILDEPEVIVPEWRRKGALTALERFYDEIWIYGLREIHEPLAPFDLSDAVAQRINYTGYIRRELPPRPQTTRYPRLTREPFALVTTGGGGDGEELIDWVISAYEADSDIPLGALLVFGPFIPRSRRAAFIERIAQLPRVDAITFDTKIEYLMQRSEGVIAMGGYNTFCEILSFDKRALIVPRRTPRLEQTIRAERAAELGLVAMLDGAMLEPGGRRDPRVMAEAIRALARQPLPSASFPPGLLDGLDRIEAATHALLQRERPRAGLSAVRA